MRLKMIDQIQRVKNGLVTVEEIVREKLVLMEQNQSCNAVVCYDKDDVLQQARTLDLKVKAGNGTGKLCGAVITIKDNLPVKGLKATAGMKAYQNYIPDRDSNVVSILRNEDAIILGKTNMPAGAMDMQTFNDVYGRTNHPDFPEYTCGGSSGGGAAAVKLGISDADIGNDFMGSIRVPAHFCGIYGMVGTDKVIPYDGIVGGKPFGSTMSSILRIGIQAAYLDDLRRIFTIVADQGRIFPAEVQPIIPKIAYTTNSGNLPLSYEYTECYKSFTQRLSEHYQVTELPRTAFDFEKARNCFLNILYPNMALSMPKAIRILMGSKMSVNLKKYLQAEEIREECITQLDGVLSDYDLILSPVTAASAFRHKHPVKMRGSQAIYDDFDIDGSKVPYAVATMGYTTPFSLTASPTVVIPIGKDGNGLPFGVQIVGRRLSDLNLLTYAVLFTQRTGRCEKQS